MEREEVQVLQCSLHGSRSTKVQWSWRCLELSLSGRGTRDCTGSQGVEAAGTQGGPWGVRRALHRCREIDLGTKPARQRTAVGKIWAATGVKGNHGEER